MPAFEEREIYDVLVVGAGMAGLLAARKLANAGRSVLILDKGRGVGGRMATRRVDGVACDHGAQFVTVRGDAFGKLMDDWLDAGIAVEWCRGFPRVENPSVTPDGHPRFRGQSGMTNIPKHLARDLSIQTSCRAAAVVAEKNGWRVGVEDLRQNSAKEYRSRALLITAPAEQALALFGDSAALMPSEAIDALRRIQFNPCYSVMATLAGPSNVPDPGGMKLEGEPLFWIADNQKKGVASAPAVTIHAGPEFTQTRWEKDPKDVAKEMLDAAGKWVGSEVLNVSVQRWRYSKPVILHDERCLVVRNSPTVVFAGDAFGGPRVEGAGISGLAAADMLIKLVSASTNSGA